jgi:signal peptidase
VIDDDRMPVIEAAPETVSPLTDEERDALYGPMRAPVTPVAPTTEDEPPASTDSPVRRPLWRRMLRLLTSAVLYAVVGLVLLLTAGPRLLPFQTFYIRSGSMRPGLPIGSLVVSMRESAQQLHVGDVITFERPGVPGDMVTHRIAAIEPSPTGPVFVTKGDANGAPDSWRVNATGDGWKYAFSLPYVGYAVGYLQSGLAGIGARGALIILGTVVALWAIWRTPKPGATEP